MLSTILRPVNCVKANFIVLDLQCLMIIDNPQTVLNLSALSGTNCLRRKPTNFGLQELEIRDQISISQKSMK